MDIKEAIEILKDENRDICYGTTLADDATKLAVEIMERTKWIPVSERLPSESDADEFGDVLVLYGENGKGIIPYGDIERFINDNYRYPVTHWMPLPEPPKEVE